MIINPYTISVILAGVSKIVKKYKQIIHVITCPICQVILKRKYKH